MAEVVTIDELLRPIPGDLPAGVSLRYDPIYDKIREARREDDSGAVIGSTPKTADHKLAVALASGAIASRSKDLQLAVWLVDSLIQREGFSGLLHGLELLRRMLEEFWDGLHPEMEDGELDLRAAPLDWLGSYAEFSKGTCPILSLRFVPLTQSKLNWLDYHESRKSSDEPKKVEAEEFDSAFDATPKAFYKERMAELAACLVALEALEKLCDSRFGHAVPSFTGLRAALEEVQNTVAILFRRKLEKEPDPAEPAPATEPEPGLAAGGMPEAALATAVTGAFEEFEGEIEGLEPKHKQEALVRIAAAARYLRRLEPSNPAPYLILRALRWGELRGRGPELDASLLVAPSTEVRTRMRTLAVNGRWVDVLELAESAAATECGRGWLDLQRYAATACENLGYTAAALAIQSALRCLLADYPNLASATLLDDTGAANPETVSWLNAISQKD